MAWVLLIYSTLPIVRPISNFLIKNTPYNLLVNGFLVFSFLLILVLVFRNMTIKLKSTYALLALIIVLYIFSLMYIKITDERIHLLQYGVLSAFIFNALRCNFKNTVSYVLAIVLTFLIGWGDELIQGILPNRFYEIHDVLINLYSGVLGLFFVFIKHRDRKK